MICVRSCRVFCVPLIAIPDEHFKGQDATNNNSFEATYYTVLVLIVRFVRRDCVITIYVYGFLFIITTRSIDADERKASRIGSSGVSLLRRILKGLPS